MKDPHSVELRHLRTFVTVAETENFTRAAERLGISQPSVSIQVRELEAALGTALFKRLGPRIALTPAGRELKGRAALVLTKLNEACQAVQDTEELVAGHVSLAVIPPLNVPWIPPVLGRLAREHPGLNVTLIEKSADYLERTVESGGSDIGAGILSHSSPNLSYEVLQKDSLVLLTPPDGPLARKRSVTAEDVAEVRLVVLPEDYVLRQLTMDAFRRAEVQPRIALEVDTIDALLATVVAAGLSTLMPSVVLRGREALGLKAVKLKDWGFDVDLGIVWPNDGEEGAGAAVKRVAELLREHVATRPAKRKSRA